MTAHLELKVNGRQRFVEAEPRDTLLDILRDSLGLTGPKKGCDETVCGACAVLVDGRAICSCTMFAVEAEGHEIVTIEGLVDQRGELDQLQKAFIEHDSLQCAFCTPGQIISAKSYLRSLPRGRVPTEAEIKEALSGNLCRCGCYNKIVEAVREVAAQRR